MNIVIKFFHNIGIVIKYVLQKRERQPFHVFQYQNIILVKKAVLARMNKYRENRKTPKRNKQESIRLEGLSPQKFGKSAYQQMTYTPSKLAENILYKEVNAMRKYEQSAQKFRQIESAHSLLLDKYEKLAKEKIGMENSLTSQVQMYKQLIEELEQSAEERQRQMQLAVKLQICQLVQQKQEQIRFVQGQKQDLENSLDQLQAIANQLEHKLTETNANLNEKIEKNEQMQLMVEELAEKLAISEQKSEAAIVKNQEVIDSLKQKAIQAQRIWRDKMDIALKEKDSESKERQKQFKEEINVINSERQKERKQNKLEIQSIQDNLEKESKRLQLIIQQKQKQIQKGNEQGKEQSQKLNAMKRGYEQEIILLAQQNAKILQQFDKVNEENSKLTVSIHESKIRFGYQRQKLEGAIASFKQNLAFSQGNFLRERERNNYSIKKLSENQYPHKKADSDSKQKSYLNEIKILKKQKIALTEQNINLRSLIKESQAVKSQNIKLKNELIQSSLGMQKCKQQFVRLGKQKDLLQIQLQQELNQNAILRKIKNQRQSEAKTWKDSYLLASSSRKK